MKPIVLGLDPGFASIGYSVVRYVNGMEEPLSMGLIQTEKSAKKSNVLASNDNFRRSREIYAALRALLRDGPDGPVAAMCAEAMSFPRSSSVAAKMAMCWGCIASLSQEFNIPLLQATPQQLKLALTDNKSASKEDVQKALKKRFTEARLSALVSDVTPSQHEHPFDALGAVVACRESEVLRMVRQMEAK